MKALMPKDLQLGNFISCFGHTELVNGIVPKDPGYWFVCHTAMNQEDAIPEDIVAKPYPIQLTEEWKRALRVEKHSFPSWIKYVHEVQNYMKWYVGIDLLDNVIWDLVPRHQEELVY